jgi:CBS domain-containing protein
MTDTVENLARPAEVDLGQIPVAEAMHHGVLTCALETPLREVARIMAEHQVHCVVACDESEDWSRVALWGVVSDLDLVGAANAYDIDEWAAA